MFKVSGCQYFFLINLKINFNCSCDCLIGLAKCQDIKRASGGYFLEWPVRGYRMHRHLINTHTQKKVIRRPGLKALLIANEYQELLKACNVLNQNEKLFYFLAWSHHILKKKGRGATRAVPPPNVYKYTLLHRSGFLEVIHRL